MQIAPQNPTQVSQSLLIELFSRFFNRLLEKEEKYPIFLEEWNSFKGLLTQNPFDLDNIFIHLATIQLNLEKAITSASSRVQSKDISYLTPKLEKGSPKNRSPKSKNNRHHSVNYTPNGNSFHSTSSPLIDMSMGQLDNSRNKEVVRRPTIETNLLNAGNLLDVPYTNTSKNYDSKNLSTIDVLGTSAGSFLDTPQPAATASSRNNSHIYSQPPEVPVEPIKVKYDLIFLASKARRMKETVQVHSDMLLGAFSNSSKKALNMQLEERTPLRRLQMYTKQENNKGPTNIHQPQSEQYNLLTEGKALPYNQVLVNYH